jgi:hypothetical protein
MIYLQYAFLALVSLPINLIAILISPILPLFAAKDYGWCDNHSYLDFEPRLLKWLGIFMTPDNSLDGDATFKRLNPPSYWSQVKWLCRNPAYSFGLRYLNAPHVTTVAGDKTIKDNDNAKEGWCFVTAGGLFQLVYIKRIVSSSRCIYINIGWNIRALVDDNFQPKPDIYQATFVFSPRISGFR